MDRSVLFRYFKTKFFMRATEINLQWSTPIWLLAEIILSIESLSRKLRMRLMLWLDSE